MKLKTVLMALLMVSFYGFVMAQEDKEGNDGTRDGNQPVNSNPHNGAIAIPRGPNVLYDQTSNPGGNGFPAQNFEAAFDAYDNMAADDFTIPAGESWDIDEFYFVGTLSTGGPVSTADISIYTDAAGAPGSVILTHAGVVVTYDGTALTATIPTTNLGAGTYWVALAVNLDFGCCGQFFWSNRTAPTNGDSHWINPLDGFGSGCTTWTPTPICGVGGGLSDALFQVRGSVVACQITDFRFDGIDQIHITGNCIAGIGLYANTPGGIVTIQASVSVSGTIWLTVPFFADSYYYLSDDGGATVFDGWRSRVTVPTLGEWGMIAFLGLLTISALYFMRKRSALV